MKFRHYLALLVPLLGAGAVLADDVKFYDKAPSVEELERQLGSGTAGDPRKGKALTRSIVFGNDSGNNQAEQRAEEPVATPAASGQRPPRPAQNAAAPQPRPPAQQVAVGDRAIAFPINFRVNSAQIQQDSIPFLDSVAGLLKKDGGVRLLIEGHTDISGAYGANVKLSRERAYSVLNYLVDQHGIDPLRLMAIGKGPDEPLGGEDPKSPRNRRVQFRIAG